MNSRRPSRRPAESGRNTPATTWHASTSSPQRSPPSIPQGQPPEASGMRPANSGRSCLPWKGRMFHWQRCAGNAPWRACLPQRDSWRRHSGGRHGHSWSECRSSHRSWPPDSVRRPHLPKPTHRGKPRMPMKRRPPKAVRIPSDRNSNACARKPHPHWQASPETTQRPHLHSQGQWIPQWPKPRKTHRHAHRMHCSMDALTAPPKAKARPRMPSRNSHVNSTKPPRQSHASTPRN